MAKCQLSVLLGVVCLFAVVVNFVYSEPQVPCYFILGDSLVDNGNNNQIVSLARANYMPYGIDFPGGPTGRFSNGLTFVDVLTDLLGFEDYIPPYVSVRGNNLLRGANFASAAAGIREETGTQLGGRITFSGQVQNYQSAVQQMINILGDENSAADHLSKCIFTVGMGSNDYLNNYFMPAYYNTGNQYTPEQYAVDLIQRYAQQLRILYNYGARKVALIGVGQIGCSPNELAQSSPNGVTCVAKINDALEIFNKKLIPLVDQFNQLKGAHFTFINIYAMNQDLITNHAAYGLKVTNTGCCGVGRNNGQITCLPYQTPCPNRADHLFWDAFHPTEAANIVIGKRTYRAQARTDAHPMDISHLARI